ncbi:MAG TPA: polysaccharide deacetylase family protein [Bacteroidales bacterium]|nr:polysaccharide deacetylase family protein [Bacteroidales bacterium]
MSVLMNAILSIDVEDGINILMRDCFGISMPPTERVIKNVQGILDIIEKSNVRGTFFILGEIASKYPGLVRLIADKGHEIGVHGYNHDQVFKLDRDTFKKELQRAKDIIESVIGAQVYGFRAPAFSISKSTSWALEIIAGRGFEYDSSIMPAKANRYGWDGFSKETVKLVLPSGRTLFEVPLSVIQVFGKNVPACGGGYLRYLPYAFTDRAIRKIGKERPAIVYLHPYELDGERYPDFFYNARGRAKLGVKLPLLIYRLNKRGVAAKLEKLVRDFNFRPVRETILDLEQQGRIKTVIIEPQD